MDRLKKILEKELSSLPRKALEALLAKKIQAAGGQSYPELVLKLADHVTSGKTEKFDWDDGRPDTSIAIDFNDEDVEKIESAIDEFLNGSLPNLIGETCRKSAKMNVRRMKANWPAFSACQEAEETDFRLRLRSQWGRPLALLRLLLSAAMEIGQDKRKRWQRSKTLKNNRKRFALSQLHARACQVTGEIIALLETGFADGAMARWRTLHEIGVIALLISEHGDDLATRYLRHEAIDAKRALDEYVLLQVSTGGRPPAKRAIAMAQRDFDSAVQDYGSDFKKPNGWASHLLKKSQVRFVDLEVASGRSGSRWLYKLASFNIHTSARSFNSAFSNLNSDDLIAGASNAGLEGSGCRTAFDMVIVTAALFEGRWSFDDLVSLHTLIYLRDEAGKEFGRCAAELWKAATAGDKTIKVKARKGR